MYYSLKLPFYLFSVFKVQEYSRNIAIELFNVVSSFIYFSTRRSRLLQRTEKIAHSMINSAFISYPVLWFKIIFRIKCSGILHCSSFIYSLFNLSLQQPSPLKLYQHFNLISNNSTLNLTSQSLILNSITLSIRI